MIKGIVGVVAKRRSSPEFQIPTIAASDTKSGTGSTVHTINAPAGSLLVLTRQAETHSSDGNVVSTPTLTWTKKADASFTDSGDAEIWTATFTAGGSITVTSTFTAFVQSSVLYAVTNSEANPQGASAIATFQSVPNVTIATTRVNSILFCVSSDWTAKSGARTYVGTPTESLYFTSANATTGYHYYKVTTGVQNYTLGLSAPTAQQAGTCILEVRTVPPGGIDTEPPTAPVLSAGITTSSSISLSWTPSTDFYGVAGYDVYVNNVFNASTTSTNYVVTGLAQLTSYNIYVVAKDAAGNSNSSNTVSASTTAADTFGTLIYSNGFDTQTSLDPFGHGQIGNGSLSTTIFQTGPGSFKAVPANVSSGIRSEVQFNEGGAGQGQTPTEGVIEWDVRYETIFQDNGHSLQFHPNTSGGSASPGLWHEGGKFFWVNWKSGTNTHYATNFTIPQNTWLHCIFEYKFGNGNGYMKFTINDVVVLDRTNITVGDGSGQYLKVGTNQWVASPSVVYYDNLKVWQR